jgi:cell pole-organizing protein PopZ
MAEQSAHEPTMEEILASIRRIISEDDAPADEAAEPEAAAAEPAPEPVVEAVEEEEEAADEDVLELTDAYDAPSSVSIGDIDAYTPEAEPEPAPAPKPTPVAAASRGPGGLVSETTETAALSSFTALTSSLLVPASDRTLEDVVRDMLKPMLQAWLDQNLPSIVEEQVRNEVERIARQSRR